MKIGLQFDEPIENSQIMNQNMSHGVFGKTCIQF